MDILEITCEDPTESGLAYKHNMPCAVCGKYHAVLFTNNGTFTPCWKCQKDGWGLVKRPKQRTFWQKLWGWVFHDYYEFSLVTKEEYSFKDNDWV